MISRMAPDNGTQRDSADDLIAVIVLAELVEIGAEVAGDGHGLTLADLTLHAEKLEVELPILLAGKLLAQRGRDRRPARP